MSDKDELEHLEKDNIHSRMDKLDRGVDAFKIKKQEDDIFKVVESVFDEKTRLILMNLINKGIILEVSGAISTGKEANVYFAPAVPEAKAIKIFRIDFPSFRKMRPYIEGDHRFKRTKSSRSGFIEAWAKKEYKNLKRLHEHNIPCPKPLLVERNILVMEYLGNDENVLPRLKEVEIVKPNRVYKAVMNSVKDIYQKARLIHADLSEFNILYDTETGQHYIIDVSQAVLWDHPRAEEFLLRDLLNINRHFLSRNATIIEIHKLYTWITGEPVNEALLAEIVGN